MPQHPEHPDHAESDQTAQSALRRLLLDAGGRSAAELYAVDPDYRHRVDLAARDLAAQVAEAGSRYVTEAVARARARDTALTARLIPATHFTLNRDGTITSHVPGVTLGDG